MALKYKLIQRKNLKKNDGTKLHHASIIHPNEVSLRTLSEEISEACTLSTVDVIAVIESFIRLAPRHLMQGEIVRLGDFGSFYLVASSAGAEKPEEFNQKMIRKTRLRFTPGKELKDTLGRIKLTYEEK